LNNLKILFFVYSISLFSQSIYEPVYNSGLYNFLDGQSLKGRILLFDEVRPYKRFYIAKNLLKLSQNTSTFTSTEKNLLDFYKKDYKFEIQFIKGDTTSVNEFFKSGNTDRFMLFKYYDEDFTFDTEPVLGIYYDLVKKKYHQYSGIKFKGRISDFVGFYFDYRDNLEQGHNLDSRKSFSPETGVVISKSKADRIEYSETRGGLTFGWRWGDLTLAKDFINIGSSYQSQVILSSKAPSFPYLRLEVHSTEWFRFNFIHGWLNSGLVDSHSIKYTGISSTFENRSKTYSRRQKYYVNHSISFMPTDNWLFTVGESIIYSDQLEYIYFLPVFYRFADHYNSMSGGDTGDNAQIFFDTSVRWNDINSKVYLSLFIDELSPESFFSGGDNAQVYAITLGGKIANPFWSDGYFTLEYTAIKPYTHMNGDPAQTYFSSGYQLGHWIGSNAVQIYAEMEQYFPYMITAKAYFNYVIKGAKENINDYYNRVTSTYPLLSGDNSYFSEIGGQISYNLIYNLFLELNFRYINKSYGRFFYEFGVKEGYFFITNIRYGF
jgi:hypothetical protein